MSTTEPHNVGHADARAATNADPQAVVEAFLAAMQASDADAAAALIDDDILYVNVSLPAIRGARKVREVLDFLRRPQFGFEVQNHTVAADGPVVLTERTDVLILGPLRVQFWVWGHFEVRDGRITVWRDSFDYLDVARGMLRGLVGMVIPGVRPRPLGDPDAVPGR